MGFQQLEWLCFILFVDIFYIFRGSIDPEDEDGESYEVTIVNVKTGDVGKASAARHVTSAAAAASSLHLIVLRNGSVAF